MNDEYFLRLDSERGKTFTQHGLSFKVKPGHLFLVRAYQGIQRCSELDNEHLRCALFSRVEIRDGYAAYVSQLQNEDISKIKQLVARYACDSFSNLTALREIMQFCKAMGVSVEAEAHPDFSCTVTFGN